MAVAPTGDIFKTLEFDGESSKDYGVYRTGEAVFNAPERDIEMISIPGRSGSFALDKGRFENIEVRYPAGLFADNELDFAEAISDFRNFLCSKKGYCRLTDDYNPDEYRLAIYKSGLEVTPAMLRGGEFEIVFDCKPQRYLMSGEAPIEVSDGDVILNPTLFEAHPLLMVEGAGGVTLNGYDIRVDDDVIGELELVPAAKGVSSYNGDYHDEIALVEDGDPMTMGSFSLELDVKLRPTSTYVKIASAAFSRPTHTIENYIGVDTTVVSDQEIRKTVKYGEQAFTKQSSTVTYTDSCQLAIVLEKSDETHDTYNYTFDIEVKNYGSTGTAARHLTIKRTNISGQKVYFSVYANVSASPFIADSSQSVLGDPTYIDCELGEAYKEVGDQILPLNRYIDLGSKLPELSPGQNEIGVEGDITSVEIVPRWWKV